MGYFFENIYKGAGSGGLIKDTLKLKKSYKHARVSFLDLTI